MRLAESAFCVTLRNSVVWSTMASLAYLCLWLINVIAPEEELTIQIAEINSVQINLMERERVGNVTHSTAGTR